MKNKNAFTLLELLVVIAIIATLAALLLPALSSAMAKANNAKCIHRMEQWARAMWLYLDVNESFFPRENQVDGANSWSDALSPDIWYNALAVEISVPPLSSYAGIAQDQGRFYENRSFFHCPSAKFGELALSYPNFSIAMNSKIIHTVTKWVTLESIQEPTLTPFFVESGVPGESLVRGQTNYNGQPHCFASRFSARHGGFGNLGMADGHVEHLPAKKVVNTNPKKREDFGKAIWPPGEVVWCPERSMNPN